MELASSTNTTSHGFSAFTGSVLIGGIGIQNLSLTSSSTIIQTTTQTLSLSAGAASSGGTLNYMGSTPPFTYLQATRIA